MNFIGTMAIEHNSYAETRSTIALQNVNFKTNQNMKTMAGKTIKKKLNKSAVSHLSRYYKRKRVQLPKTTNNEEGD